ncbi:hypothetical protein N9S30_00340 [bacterium]|nr:hypothetical protein [bacterium]
MDTPKTVEAQFDELRTANAKHLAESTAIEVQTSSPVVFQPDGAAKLTMADLSETERAVATLGVDPSALKPIGFMNTAHYTTLLQSNALDGDLARRLEAYRTVSAGGQ